MRNFADDCGYLRREISDVGDRVVNLMNHEAFAHPAKDDTQNHREMKANIMLAFRHLEDARMRLGKAIQAFDGGKSVYDR